MRVFCVLMLLTGCSVAVEDYSMCERDLDDYERLACMERDSIAFARCVGMRNTCVGLGCDEELQSCIQLVFNRNPSCELCYFAAVFECLSDNGCGEEVQDLHCCQQTCESFDDCCGSQTIAVNECAIPVNDTCQEYAAVECLVLPEE